MKSENQHKIRLGLFVTIGLLIFLVSIYLIGSKKSLFGNTSHIVAIFKDANGLQLGNNVRYSGVNAGTVKQIQMLNDTTIRITMLIDNDIFKNIKKNAIATISSDGLVGNMIVSISPGDSLAENVSDNGIILSKDKISTDAMLNTLSKTNINAELLSVELLKISNEILHGKGAVGALINDEEITNNLKETLKNLNTTSVGIVQTADHLKILVASLDNKNNLVGVLKDTVVAFKIKDIIANLDSTSTNINNTILNLKNGKGAINYLSNDSNLVIKIDSTVYQLNQASIKLNENLEALKYNWFFKIGFKKIAKEKAKQEKK